VTNVGPGRLDKDVNSLGAASKRNRRTADLPRALEIALFIARRC